MNNKQKSKIDTIVDYILGIFLIVLFFILCNTVVYMETHTKHVEPVYHWAIG